MWKIPSTSTEFLGPITIPSAALSDSVDIAVIPRGIDEPADADWHRADIWDGSVAWLKIGPQGTLTLTDGMYQAFARVTTAAEKPVIEIEDGLVRIT